MAVAGITANLLGCKLDTADFYPCILLGIDIGVLLGVMGVMGYFMLLTIPLLVLIIIVWFIVAVVHWYRYLSQRDR